MACLKPVYYYGRILKLCKVLGGFLRPCLGSLAPVAQWIEHLPSKQTAVGSSPTWGVFLSNNMWLLVAVVAIAHTLHLQISEIRALQEL
jgi:hypothetical protein